MQRTQKQPHWNLTNSGHLSYKKQIKCGFGLLSAERLDKLLHELLEIEAKTLVESCGTLFQKRIALGIAIQISGVHIKRSFLKSTIQLWGKKRVKLLMSSAGIIHFGSVLVDLFEKRSHSLNRL